MFFEFNEEERMVQKTVKNMLENHTQSEDIRSFMKSQFVSKELKQLFGKQGLLGVLEPNGEAVTGITYAILISQEAGRRILPYPLLENLVGLYALKKCENQESLIRDVEDGKQMLTVAWSNQNTLGVENDNNFSVSGKLLEVPFAADADKIIASIRIQGVGDTPQEEETVIVLDSDNPAVNLKKRTSFDETYPIYDVFLNDYPLQNNEIVEGLGLGIGYRLMNKVRQVGSLLIAAEMVGTSERALYDTVAYTKERKQFDSVIARFQALKHMAAEMYLQVESAKVAVEYGAWAIESNDKQVNLAISTAKAYSSTISKKITGNSIQMQGGIGFAWENDLHLFFKRATRSASLFGNTYMHNEQIAKYTLDGANVL